MTEIRSTLPRRLDALHAAYVAVVNEAVAADDLARVDELVAAYDVDVRALTREHEARAA